MECQISPRRNQILHGKDCWLALSSCSLSCFPRFFWLQDQCIRTARGPGGRAESCSAQAELPFQVLIPAYLPKFFNREKMEIITDQPGPNGEKMIQLIYSTRKGRFTDLE